MKSLYLSGGMVVWMSKVMEDCLRNSGKMDSYQSRREGDRVFMVQRGHNSYGRFVKLIEYGTGTGKGILMNLEGRKGSGWAGFVRNMREMVGSPSSVSTHDNRIFLTMVLLHGILEVITTTSHRGATSYGEASYVSALLKPVLGHSCSHQKSGNGY